MSRTELHERARPRLFWALASTALAGMIVAETPRAAHAQGNNVEVAPVEVTARKRQPAPKAIAKPAPKPRPTPVVRAEPAPPRRVVARPARSTISRPVRRVQRNVVPPTASAQPPGVGAPSAGFANGGTGERPNGPVPGFVSTRSGTGTKTNTPRIENPQSISVVGREQIDTLKSQSLLEATRYTPGIVSETFGNDTRNDFFLIRGFPAEQTGIFLNGLQLPSTAFGTFKLEPFGLERIEVLRGPASVLYGGTNPGGLINAVSKRPGGTPFNYVEFGVNNFGNAYGAFDFNSPAYTNQYGTFFTRLTGIGKGGSTQTDFIDDDRGFIAPSLTWLPNADTSLTILTSYQHDHTNGQNFLPYLGTVQRAPFGRIPTSLFTSEPSLDTFDRDQLLLGYEFAYRFNDAVQFRQNFRYSHVDVNDRTVFGGGYALAPTATDAELTRFNFITTPHVNIYNVDNQAEFKFRTGPLFHTALTGIDYKHYSIADDQGFAFGPTLNLLNPVYQTAIDPPNTRFRLLNEIQDQLGVYAQDQIKFGRFTLVVSGREDFVQTRIDDKLTPASSSLGHDSAFSGRAGLIYTSDFGLAPYVSYSNSFVPQFGTLGATSTPLKPETGEQYEAGVKYQPFGNLGYLSAAVFDLTRQNVVTTDPNNFLFSQQTGEIRSRGLELEATANLSQGLKLVSAFTAYDIETTRSLDPTTIGKLPPNTPDRIGSIFADYTAQTGVVAGLGGGAGVRYVGRSFADPQNAFRVPDRLLTDLTLHYERQGWRAAINVNNLLDDKFVAGCSSVSACFYGERRRVLGTVRYKW